MAAVRALDRFDRRRPFGPWLNRIVINRAIDWARARSLRREAETEPEHLQRGSDHEAPAPGHPYSEEILAALASLSPEHRAVVVLRYLLECTPGEIARDARSTAGHGELAPSSGARSVGGPAGRGAAVNERRLEEILRRAPIPDQQGAEERGWRVVRAAFESHDPAPRRPPRGRLLVAVAVGLLALAIGLSPAGAEVANVFKDVTGVGHRSPQPALTSLPAPGRLLVGSGRGAWVVSEDGSMRLLGNYTDAAWSPHGLFIAVTRGRQLSAVEPDGTLRWSIAQNHPVSDPRWSPSGYRVAYLSGSSLRVLAGDGTEDQRIESQVARVAPAWQPVGPAALRASPSGVGTHRLAFARADGRIEVVNTDSQKVLWGSPPGPTPKLLEWSADGERLLALDSGGWRLFASNGQLLVNAKSPGGVSPASASFAPRGRTLAVVETRTGGGAVADSSGGRVPLSETETKLTGLDQTSRVVLVQPDRPRRSKPCCSRSPEPWAESPGPRTGDRCWWRGGTPISGCSFAQPETRSSSVSPPSLG